MSTQSRAERGRILLLDPSPASGAELVRSLRGLGSVAREAALEGAVARLQSARFDLIVASLRAGAGAVEGLLDPAAREKSAAEWQLLLDPGWGEAEDGEAARSRGIECPREMLPAAAVRRSAAQLLELRRLRAENDRQRGLLRAIEEGRELGRCLDTGKLYPLALDVLLRATSHQRGLVVFRRAAPPHDNAVALRGFSETQTREICRALLDQNKIEVERFDHIQLLDRGVLHESLRRVGIELGNLLVVPLSGEREEAGIICLFDDGHSFCAQQRERVEWIAAHTETALCNAEAYSRAKERAFVDDVTELYNARYLLTTAGNELQRAARYGNPLSILFLDLDRFKLVNDRFGHLIGSETLRRLSRLLAQCVRQVDTLARYGGDEFTILLVDTAHPEAMQVAERIRQTVAGYAFEAGRDEHLRLTISIGVATCPDHGRAREELLDLADKAMYLAKAQGRDRICSATELGRASG